MSKLLWGLLQAAGGESSNSSSLSRWRQAISDLVDTLFGAAAVAWATIPAVATAPNNAACLEKT